MILRRDCAEIALIVAYKVRRAVLGRKPDGPLREHRSRRSLSD